MNSSVVLRRMKKQPLVILVLASLVWIAVACNSGSAPTPMPTLTTQLDQAEKKWTGQNITNYRMEVLVVSSIWHAQSHQIIVQNNAVVESTARCIPAPIEAGTCEVRAYTAEEYTIPGLFAQARSQIQSQQAQWIKITYDPTYGFPSQISFDNPNIVDEDRTWRVTTFEPLK
jgi:hypothetical protein